MDAVLEKFDASKAKVRQEIREGFFHADGTLRISETELRAWVADRAVDELKVVFQLAAVLAKSAHLIPPPMLVQVTEQLSDESRHFDILRTLVPDEMQLVIDAKVAQLPHTLGADTHWVALMVAVDAGNPFAALLDINIVHEGYSAAAIEELKNTAETSAGKIKLEDEPAETSYVHPGLLELKNAEVLLRIGDVREAHAFAEASLSLGPADPRGSFYGYATLAQVLAAGRQAEESLVWAEKALMTSIGMESWRVRDRLALVTEALEPFSGSSDVREFLGRAHRTLNTPF